MIDAILRQLPAYVPQLFRIKVTIQSGSLPVQGGANKYELHHDYGYYVAIHCGILTKLGDTLTAAMLIIEYRCWSYPDPVTILTSYQDRATNVPEKH
jgi:hypothetical protein